MTAKKIKSYVVSEDDLQALNMIAKSLYFADQKLFTGSEETTRDYCEKIKVIIEKIKKSEFLIK